MGFGKNKSESSQQFDPELKQALLSVFNEGQRLYNTIPYQPYMSSTVAPMSNIEMAGMQGVLNQAGQGYGQQEMRDAIAASRGETAFQPGNISANLITGAPVVSANNISANPITGAPVVSANNISVNPITGAPAVSAMDTSAQQLGPIGGPPADVGVSGSIPTAKAIGVLPPRMDDFDFIDEQADVQPIETRAQLLGPIQFIGPGQQVQAQSVGDPGQVAAQQVAAPGALSADQLQAQRFANTDLDPYINPYEEQVVGQALSDIERARQMQQNRDAAAATAAGAFGSDRHGIVDAETNRAALEQAARTSAQLRRSGFDAASRLAQSDIANDLAAQRANQSSNLQAGQFSRGQTMQGLLANQSAGLQAQARNQNANLARARANQAAALQAAQGNQQIAAQQARENMLASLQAATSDQSADLQSQLANQAAGLEAGISGRQANLDAQRANMLAGLERSQTDAANRLQAGLAFQDADLRAQLANQAAGTATQDADLRAQLANQQAALQNQQMGLDAARADQAADLQSQLADQDAALQADIVNRQTRVDSKRANMLAQLEAARANQDAALQADIVNRQTRVDSKRDNMLAQLEAARANQDAALKADIVNRQTRVDSKRDNMLAQLEADRANQAAALAGSQQRMAAANQLANLGGDYRNLMFQDPRAMMGIGQMQRDQAQRIMDDQYRRYIAQRDFPLRMFDVLRGAAGILPNPLTSESKGRAFDLSIL